MQIAAADAYQLDAFLEETIRLWTDERSGFDYPALFADSAKGRKRKKHLVYRLEAPVRLK